MLLSYSTIKNDFSSLPSDDNWSFKDTRRSETNYISHGYHRYPAKFIPQIVKKLILNFTDENDIVFDPFGGCGTTLVEAKTLGRKSVSFDINPVAKLIAETKITPIKPVSLKNYFDKFMVDYDCIRDIDSLPRQHSERINYWFDHQTQKELDKLYLAINKIKNSNVRKFYLCALSHILKNSSKWLMKSTKPQIDPNKVPVDVFQTFVRHLKKMMSKNEDFYKLLQESGNLNTTAKMKLSDSTKKFPLENDSLDLIITSPPYVTSYEYADLHQLILLWLGDDPQKYPRWHKYAQEYHSFRKKFVGSKLGEHSRSKKFPGIFAHHIINQLPNTKQYAKSVSKYFSDMQKSISEMFRVLKPGNKACIIIGNTTLAGVEIKNAEVAAEQMQDAGFVVKQVIKRKLSNKMITPWRNSVNGRFTSTKNPHKVRVYEHEFIIIAEKPTVLSN
ncbi:site-specific DNA-methyltransferase [Patescibacteria group bacterium]|nr:site-specific DNA-methyltransferase [Patescibacteria group bacterium]